MAAHQLGSRKYHPAAIMGAAATATAVAVSLGVPPGSANAATSGAGDTTAVAPAVISGGELFNNLTAADASAALAGLNNADLTVAGVNIGELVGNLWRAISIGPLLQRFGIDLSTVISDLIAEKVPVTGDGFRLVTTGQLMALLEFIGANPTWVPGFADQIAGPINSTPYGIKVTEPIELELANWRLPIVLGTETGAFAAGKAYLDVVADLANQPASTRTVLPMLLLFNPGRPNGGLFARFAPIAQVFGRDPVTPDVQTEKLGTLNPRIIWPLKVDATFEYELLSDFPSWLNPVAIANSAASAVFITYALRNNDVNSIVDEITKPLLDSFTTGNLLALFLGLSPPDAVNAYVTIDEPSLPLLEPARYPTDLINLVFGTNLSNPFADAIEPALKLLVNLGYTDVNQASPTYDRTLDQAGTPTSFFNRPDVDWSQVPGDLVDALVHGIKDAFFSGGIPGVHSTPQGNPLKEIADLLGGLSSANPISSLSLVDQSTAALASAVPDAIANAAAGLPTATEELDSVDLANGTSATSSASNSVVRSADPEPKTQAKRPLRNVVRGVRDAFTPRPKASTASDSGAGSSDPAGDPSAKAG